MNSLGPAAIDYGIVLTTTAVTPFAQDFLILKSLHFTSLNVTEKEDQLTYLKYWSFSVPLLL